MERIIFASSLESLFIRGLSGRISPAGLQALRELGIDLNQLRPGYTLDVWNRAVEVAARDVYPTLSLAEAQFELGQRGVLGMNDTLVGKATVALAKLVGPRRTMHRIPHTARAGSNYVGIEVHERSPCLFEVTARPYASHPDYLRGALTAAVIIGGGQNARSRLVSWEPAQETAQYEFSWDAT